MSDIKIAKSDLPDVTILDHLASDIHLLIEEARQSVATVVNAGVTLLYWRIGHRLTQELLQESRAEYGKRILATLSQTLITQANKARILENFEELEV